MLPERGIEGDNRLPVWLVGLWRRYLGTRIESFGTVQSIQNDQSGSLPDFSWLGRTAKRWLENEIRLFRRDFLKLLGQDSNLRQGG